MQRKKLSREQALQKLRHYCRYQERCRMEVRNKMAELGVPKTDHEALIEILLDEKYLDEVRFALSFAIGHFRMRHWGKRKIRFELKAKYIRDHDIATALAGISEEEYSNGFQNLARDRYAGLDGEHHLTRKKKTMDFLTQKGFEPDLVRDFLNQITKQKDQP